MNCTELSLLTGWDCYPAGENAVRAISPFTLGEDGEHAAFYIAQTGNDSYFITDAGESLMQATSLGVQMSKSKLDSLNNTFGVKHAKFQKDGSITSQGHISDTQNGLWDSAKLVMSLSFNSARWMPKLDQLRFKAMVQKLLYSTIDNSRIIKPYKAQGMSGHVVEFPFAIKMKQGSFLFIEPIALSNEKVDWGHIYQVHGKLSDVKQADTNNERLVIFEDYAPKVDYGRAATLLSQTATIITFSDAESWAKAA